MYLRCDGTLTVDVNGYPTCDNWATVTTDELLGTAIQSRQLSVEDFGMIGAGTVAIMVTAFAVRLILKTLVGGSK